MAEDDAKTDETDETGTAPGAKKAPARKSPARRSPTKRSPAKKAPAEDTDTDTDTGRAKEPSSRRTADAPRAEPPRRPRAGGIAREAAVQLYELTGNEIEGITAVHRDGDGWVVEVDVLELRRIPATTDVLATYEVEMDDSGDLTGYRRRHRFTRGSVSEDR